MPITFTTTLSGGGTSGTTVTDRDLSFPLSATTTLGSYQGGGIWAIHKTGMTIADDPTYPVDTVNRQHGSALNPDYPSASGSYGDKDQALDGRLRTVAELTGQTGTFAEFDDITQPTSSATSRIAEGGVLASELRLEVVINGPFTTGETISGPNGSATISQQQTDYNPAILPSYPISSEVGLTLFKAKSRAAAAHEDRSGLCDQHSVLYIVDSVQSANAFAPPMVWESAWGPRPSPVVLDMDTVTSSFKATLPTGGYDVSGFSNGPPSFATIEAAIGQFMPAYPFHDGSVFYRGGYETLGIPYRPGASGNNYGEAFGNDINDAYTYAISNQATDAQIKSILTWLISMGLQWLPVFKGANAAYNNSGAHYQFAFIPMMLAEWAQGKDFTDLVTHYPGNQICHTVKWTSALITDKLAKHTENSDLVDKAYIARVRFPTAVTTDTITVPRDSSKGDPGQVRFYDLAYYRASDDVFLGNATEFSGLEVTVIGHGLTTSDGFYCQPTYTIQDGDYDWISREPGGNDKWHNYNPSPVANYRFQQYFGMSAVAAILQGGSNPVFESLIGYVDTCIDPTSNLFISVSTGGSSTYPADTAFGVEFLDTYWSTINV